MKKTLHYIILCLVAGLLTACYSGDDTWFYHTISYEGNDRQSQLALSANMEVDSCPQIFVNTAYFVGDKAGVDTIYRNPQYSYYETQLNRGYVHGAEVCIRVNGGEWMTLRETRDTIRESEYTAGYNDEYVAYYYTCDYVLQPLDSVDIRVRDAASGREASTSVRMPERVTAQVTVADSAAYVDIVGSDAPLLFLSLQLPAFRPNGDLLRLRAATFYSYVRDAEKGQVTSFQTVGIYAHDTRFADYSDICLTTEKGWYGATCVGLVGDAPHEKCSLLLAVEGNQEGWKSKFTVDSILVDVSLISRSTYLFYGSLMENDQVFNLPYNPWQSEETEDVEIMLEEIEDMFEILGDMESVPIYSNIDGGYGRVLCSSRCRLCLLPEAE